MASVDDRAVLLFFKSWLAARGGIDQATIGEPMSAPVNHVHGAVQFRGIEIVALTLTHAIEHWKIALLVYFNAMDGTPEDLELDMILTAKLLLKDVLSDMDLGDMPNIRSVEPVEMEINAGFQQIQQKWFRTIEIVVVVTVDDSTPTT